MSRSVVYRPERRRPVIVEADRRRGVRSEAGLRALFEEEDFVPEWTRYEVPNSKRPLLLPDTRDSEWNDVVEELVEACGAHDSSGPWTGEHRQSICRSGHVYFILSYDNGDVEISIVGQFAVWRKGITASIAKSSAFVIGGDGVPVSLWLDQDAESPDVEDEFDYDDDDDDDDDDPGNGDGDDEEDEPMDEDRLRLLATTITDHKGLVLAGVDAVTVLPSDGQWVVIPSSGRLHASITAQVGDTSRGWISVGGVRTLATLTDRLCATVAVRIGRSHGCRAVYQLDGRKVSEIDVDREVAVARVLRDRVRSKRR